MEAIIQGINKYRLQVEFNLVRYNPYKTTDTVSTSTESSNEIIKRNLDILNKAWSRRVKMIPRVGIDVHASCGTFHESS